MAYSSFQSLDEKNHDDSRKLSIIPSQINLNDLFDGIRLYTKKEVAAIKNALKDQPDDYYSKKHALLKELPILQERTKKGLRVWSVYKKGNQCYAAYYGVKHKKEIGLGGQGKVIVFQDIGTGECYAGKKEYIDSTKEPNVYKRRIQRIKKEAGILKELGRLVVFGQKKSKMNNGYRNTYITLMKYHEGIELFYFILCSPGN